MRTIVRLHRAGRALWRATAHTRAPATGLWKPSAVENTTRDDIVIYEVMAGYVDAGWWKAYRSQLEARFRQQRS